MNTEQTNVHIFQWRSTRKLNLRIERANLIALLRNLRVGYEVLSRRSDLLEGKSPLVVVVAQSISAKQTRRRHFH